MGPRKGYRKKAGGGADWELESTNLVGGEGRVAESREGAYESLLQRSLSLCSLLCLLRAHLHFRVKSVPADPRERRLWVAAKWTTARKEGRTEGRTDGRDVLLLMIWM